MSSMLILLVIVLVTVKLARLAGRRTQHRLPPLGEGGRHSRRELQTLVNQIVLPAFDRPDLDRFEYLTGGQLGWRDLPVIQDTLGRGFDAHFRPDAPGVLVVDRRRRR